MNSSSVPRTPVLLLLAHLFIWASPARAQAPTCCGPNLGPQAISWLQLPTNTTQLLPDPSGANGPGTWIIANLPGYGPVLVIQDTPTNIVAVCTNADFGRVHSSGSFEYVPNSNGCFNFTESLPGPYGPYSWGIPPGSVALGYAHMYTLGGQGAPLPPYQVSFYFLNGQPDPCRLVWSTIGLAEHTTNRLSQPLIFRTEYDLVYDPTNYPLGPSAETVLDGIYGGPLTGGVSGTVVSSGFDMTGGDDFNTGWSVFQPTNNLFLALLPSGTGLDVNGNPYPPSGTSGPRYPYLTVTVNHQLSDIFSQTVGYLCCTNCPTNCLEVECSSGKMVPCGSAWTFDPPTVSSCCAGFLPGTTTNVEVLVLDTVTNGVCPQFITRSWLVVDACDHSNSCSQIVTVVGCCSNNCLQVSCPPAKTVDCGSAWSFDTPGATTCCTNSPAGGASVSIVPTGTVTNGVCPQVSITQSWFISDSCGNSTNCSQTVTVLGCCSNTCCGPYPGPQTIQWLEFPAANSTPLSPDPTDSNGPGTWIVTNLPCYGRVLVTQTFPNSPNLVYWFQNPNFLNVPNAAGSFFDTQLGYSYNWGNYSSILDFYNANSSTPIGYTVNFYFLDGPPNPCSLVLGVAGLAEYTTATLSQPMTFRGEYDLYAGDVPGNGRASAYTTMDGSYPAAGLTGTVVGSAYGVAGPGFGVGDWQNTGWALLQPTNNLSTVPLPPGSGAGWPGPMAGVPVLSLAVNQEGYDGIGFTVGYICCPQAGTNCLTVQCPPDKTVDCGVPWSFDTPAASSCCTNASGTTGANVSIIPTGTVTNGVCPQVTITRTWLITDACGDTTNCSQTVTVIGCCSTNCLQVQCPPDKTIECGDALSFDPPLAATCCTNNPFGTSGGPTITPLGTVTNGSCPQVTITQNWLITDGCGDSNTCSQTVTVLGCCSTNCLQVQCPPDKTVDCGSALSFDTPTATTCCNNNPAGPPVINITPVGTVTNGVCPQVTITENWLITDGCGDSNTCSQTVTVFGCCPTNCCGPTAGTRTIQWLEFPAANSTPLSPDPTGSNGPGTWIVTNLPCYGRVLVTQTFPNSPNLVYWFQNPNFLNVPNADGTFFDTQAGYSYDWGNYSSILDFYNGSSSTPIGYTVNFYFLDGPPNPCSLVLAVAGLAETTTTTLSQPMTFRGEFDLYAGDVPGNGRASAYTTMDGSYPAAGLTGTVVGSAYGVSGPGFGVGDWQNTGWALLQPTNNLATVPLPPGSGAGWPGPMAGVPVLSLAVNQEGYDGIGFTVGYICCPPGTNCLTVQCPADKAVDCGVAWSFDLPTATTCCTNGSGTTGANVIITPTSTVTNGVCPQVNITQTWVITDACGNSATCRQTVTVIGCCSNNCLQVQCPPDKTIECGDGLTFDRPTATTCCTNNPPGTPPVNIALIGTVTNGSCPQVTITEEWLITDACGNSNLCSQTVTVLGCCTNCLQVQCPPGKTVQCGSAFSFDAPSATTCCPSNFVTSAGTLTNVLITPIGVSTSGICPKVITQTWSIVDACGDRATCSQSVTVVDTTPPLVSCLTNVVVVPLNRNCDLVIPPIKFIARDNCTPASQLIFHQSPPAGTIETNHSQVVTVTVTDLCGNSNQCSVLVLGVDELPPFVAAPASVEVTNCLVPCVTGLVIGRDPCCPPGSLLITQSPPCNTPLAPGINSITVTVTDCNGNTTTRVIHLLVSGPVSFLGSLFNTGEDASHALLPDDAVDPHYALPPTAVPPGMPSDYHNDAVAVSPACYSGPGCGYWLSPGCFIYVPWTLASPFSKWIGPDLTNNGCCPRGTYQYTFTFTLPAGLNPASATISGRWAADNNALLYLNANPLPVAFTPTFAHWTPFTIPAGSGFLPGANTLTFAVSNSEAWTALRVEFTNAFANCYTCAPPAIISITPSQTLPLFGVATFNLNAGGTPPLSYQWYHNNTPLVNNAHDSGVTTPTLHVAPLAYSDAGLYSVIVSNPCGVVTGYVRLRVTRPWNWQWGWWNVDQLDNPLAATVGPDLVLAGSSGGTNFSLSTGTSDDFGLPAPGAQAVNLMHVLLPTDTSLRVPLIAPPGSNSVNSYTVLMDLYEPDTSYGMPGTLFQSQACCTDGTETDAVKLGLDMQNMLHISGVAAGVPFDVASTIPLLADSWNRLALVLDDPQDGMGVNLSLYLNGQSVASLTVPTSIGLPINWSNSPPILLSRQTNDPSANPELYAANLQFHDIALDPQLLAGLGSTGSGPFIPDQGLVGTAPVLSATLANGSVTLSWTGSGYALQETTDLRSGAWMDSEVTFTETQAGSNDPQTTAHPPNPNAPAKFYRLVFRP